MQPAIYFIIWYLVLPSDFTSEIRTYHFPDVIWTAGFASHSKAGVAFVPFHHDRGAVNPVEWTGRSSSSGQTSSISIMLT